MHEGPRTTAAGAGFSRFGRTLAGRGSAGGAFRFFFFAVGFLGRLALGPASLFLPRFCARGSAAGAGGGTRSGGISGIASAGAGGPLSGRGGRVGVAKGFSPSPRVWAASPPAWACRA
jgi:hypothetical protein